MHPALLNWTSGLTPMMVYWAFNRDRVGEIQHGVTFIRDGKSRFR